MSSIKNEMAEEGFVVLPLKNLGEEILNRMVQFVTDSFVDSLEAYCQMDNNEYRDLIACYQNQLNEWNIAKKLASSERAVLEEVLGSDILVQSGLYLRATRPMNSQVQEYVSWNREQFYGQDLKNALNFWLPIKGVVKQNMFQYIPKSHLIDHDEIQTASVPEELSSVKRFSSGHQIGLVYAPKKIISGVDFSKAQKMEVPNNHYVLFSADLVHGNAINKSRMIRFSLDFRLTASHHVCENKFHFSSGKPYFVPLDD